LREAALRHLARYAATQARLLRVLDRRIDRWQRAASAADPGQDAAGQAAQSRAAARRVVAALAAAGVVNDAAYAAGRARTLLRAGKSRAKVAQHLAIRGVDRATIRDALPEDGSHDLAAALLLVRKRRLGAFATDRSPAATHRALGVLARAGFSHATARAALAASAEAAEAAIAALRHA
jgi:regulatory protein